MRILTEAEYERRLREARQEGAREEERRIMERQEFDGFRRSIWEDMENIKRSYESRLCRLEERMGPTPKPETGSVPVGEIYSGR